MISVTTWVTAGVGLVLVGLLGAQTVRLADEKAGRADDRAQYSQRVADAAEAHATELEKQRDEYERRIGVKDETIKLATLAASAARSDAVGARVAGDSMRKRAEALVADAGQAGRCAEPSAPSNAAEAPARVLADMLGRSDTFAGIVAEYADSARIAGEACVGQYTGLK